MEMEAGRKSGQRLPHLARVFGNFFWDLDFDNLPNDHLVYIRHIAAILGKVDEVKMPDNEEVGVGGSKNVKDRHKCFSESFIICT